MTPDPNLPIGLFKDFGYTGDGITLKAGTTLLLYTDGLTEAENPDSRLYGEQRLTETLEAMKGKSAQDIVLGIYTDAQDHVQSAVQSDDMTIMAIQYRGTDTVSGPDRRILTLSNKVSELEKLTLFIDDVCESAGVDIATAMSINLAMEEAVSNIIFYAYPGGETEHTITVRYARKDHELHFDIYDRGVPFDPTARAEADVSLSAEERKIGGLGIFLVKQIMDRVEYERRGDENILKLTKII